MITGVVPEEALERVHHDQLLSMRQYDKKIPNHIAAAIEKGLSVEYKDRQQSMQELYNDLYATKRQLKEKREDKIYAVIRKVLIFMILILLVTILGSVLFITYRDKISNFESRVEKVFSEEEEQISETETQEKPQTEEVSEDASFGEDETIEEETVKAATDTDTETAIPEPDEEETMLSEESTPVQATIADQEMEHALVVVRQGCLNGKSEEYTVEDILNQYCDKIGSWSARRDETGDIYVVFSGSKAGEKFTLDFQLLPGDTFKLTGATKNGQEYERYSEFFQSILDEVGV
jgi:hypothetical protein